ncbi:MAG: hypothetical protein P8Y70_10470 [Candidatus Lokiarchaeota archaeon]
MSKDLQKSLKCIFSDLIDIEIINGLAEILEFTLKNRQITIRQFKKLLGRNYEDVLFLVIEKKLLIPESSYRGLEWQDSKFLLKNNEKYRLPMIIKYLVQLAKNSGMWNIEKAIRKTFKNIQDKDYKKMPQLVYKLYKKSENYQIDGNKIKRACKDLGLEKRAGAIVSELKGTGIMSPRLGVGLFASLKNKSPIYELNPSLI